MNDLPARSDVFLRKDIEAILNALAAARPDLDSVFDLVRIPFHIPPRTLSRPSYYVIEENWPQSLTDKRSG